MRIYNVYLHSEPGFWEYYSGKITVKATSVECAIEFAKTKLKNGAFPDRPRNSWIIDNVTTPGIGAKR